MLMRLHEIWWVYCSVLELCCRFSARSKVVLRLRRPCGWPGTCRLLGPPWSFQRQGSWGLQEAGLMLMPCLAGRSSWMICFMFDKFSIFKRFANIWLLAGVVRPRSSTAGWRCSQPWARSLSKWVCIAGWDSDSWPCMNFGFFIILVQGYIAPEYYRFDGYLSPSMNLKFSDVPNGLKVQLRRWCRVIFIDFQRVSLGFNNMFHLYMFIHFRSMSVSDVSQWT